MIQNMTSVIAARTLSSPMAGMQLNRLGLSAAAIAVTLDQLSKYWLLDVFDMPEKGRVYVTPFFDLVMAWNRGVSFSMFAADTDLMRWVLVGLTSMIAIVVVIWLSRIDEPWASLGLGLVLGGALGNIYDRVQFGAVADFFHFHWAEWYFPAFNIADSAITIGVGLLLVDSLFLQPKRTKQ